MGTALLVKRIDSIEALLKERDNDFKSGKLKPEEIFSYPSNKSGSVFLFSNSAIGINESSSLEGLLAILRIFGSPLSISSFDASQSKNA